MVEPAQFNAQLRQLRDPVAGDNIGMALTEELHHAIETELDREQRPAHHFVNFAIAAHGFTHAYQTVNFTVGEFLQRTACNESFNPDRRFQVDVVFVSMPGPGSGHRKQSNPGRRCLDRENKKKRCIITIKNRDASALPQRSRRGRVSPMGQFEAWASCAVTSSPRVTSASRGG